MICFIRNRDNYTLRKRLHYFSAFTRKALTALIAVLCIASLCHGQDAGTAPDSGEEEIRPLKIGDTIPEALWNTPLQVVNHPEGKDTITLNDYRDKKLIILDFWATWCGSCLNSLLEITKMNNFDEASIVLVTEQTEEDIEDSKSFKYRFDDFRPFTIINDSFLSKIFGSFSLPHLVWLGDNQIQVITTSRALNEESIHRAVQKKIFPNGKNTNGMPVRNTKVQEGGGGV